MSEASKEPNEATAREAESRDPGAREAAAAGANAKGAAAGEPGARAAAAKTAAAPKAPRVQLPKLRLPAIKLPALPYLMIGVVAGSLIAGAALGALLVAPRVNSMRHSLLLKSRLAPAGTAGGKHKQDKDKARKKDKKGEAGKSPVYKLDNIIVNPAGSQGQRFLMCSVAIESDDSKALDTLREHEIELRDRVVTLMSQQSLERLTSDTARDSLRNELLRVIRPVLGPDSGDTELKVFLPQFVVQ